MAAEQAQAAPSQGATRLYRAPTWARNIDFGSGFDLDLSSSTTRGTQGAEGSSSTSTSSPTTPSKPKPKPIASSHTNTALANHQVPSTSASSSPKIPFTPVQRPPKDAAAFPSPRVSPQQPSGNHFPRGAYADHSRGKSWSSSTAPGPSVTAESTPRAPQGMRGAFSPPGPSHLRSSSTEWARSTPNSYPTQAHFGSSADAYATLPAHHTEQDANHSGNFFRPGTSMSMFSQEDGLRGAASSYATHATGDSLGQNPRRASVLSFQTAFSGLDNQRSTDNLRSDASINNPSEGVEEINSYAPTRPFNGTSLRPGSASGYASSTDQAVPGGWDAGAGSHQIGRGTFRGSQPNSARQSPVMPTSATLGPSYPTTPGVATSDSEFKDALSEPSESPRNSRSQAYQSGAKVGASPGVQAVADGNLANEFSHLTTLDRNRTLKPTHGRQHSQQTSLDLKDQPPLPPAANASGGTQASRTAPRQANAVSEKPVPSVPDEEDVPPLPAKEYHTPPSGPAPPLTSPSLLSDNVIPPPLPDAVAAPPEPIVTNNFQAPVSDFRKKPLVDVTPAMQAAGRASLQKQTDVAGVGAHDATLSSTANGAAASSPDLSPVTGRARSGSNAGLLPRAALVEAPVAPPQAADTPGRSSVSSIETPSRESSPPPEGEVEARAEWERARMKQKQTRNAQEASAASRRTTFRGQLKPLQLVSAEEQPERPEAQIGGRAANAIESPLTATPANAKSGGAMSTQQLQRQQARDQRRSVGTINMAMGGGEIASGANGPYPVFPSPSTSATPGGRLYPGMLPQRSLVPPFELQQRPDGLLSGLIGPDGVRRSVNDPEVCLECMMRDEDMIDVNVLGPGLWERESDRDFEEALRLEAEEDLRRAYERGAGGSTAGEEQSAAGHSSSHAAPSREGSLRPGATGTKVRVKRVGKYDPLTVDRLKLHTQMNPPASSHRWRTLQNFLAVQAKYIAMEQRARQEEWDRTHPGEARTRQKERSTTSSAPLTTSSGRQPSTNGDSPSTAARKSISRNRSASAMMPKSSAKLVDDEDLPPAEKAAKERDIALAREARRKNAASSEGGSSNRYKQVPPPPPQSGLQSDEERRRRTSTPISINTNVSRKPGSGLTTPGRGTSSSDLRSISGAMLSPVMPSTPDSLAPPTMAISSLSTPKGFAGRTASQLSLAPSGSMLDMHLSMGGSNMADHRAGHGNLALPSPMELDRSGSASHRHYFGFPGDGELSPADPSANFSRSFQEESVAHADPRLVRNDSASKKKKGFRGFFSKLSGHGAEKSDVGSKRSEDSGSPRVRRGSFSAEAALAPPPGISTLLSRARRSTSSLLGGRESVEMSRADIYAEPPGMSSPDRFDMGPFQPPLPPERKHSKLSPEERAASAFAGGPQAPQGTVRSSSSGNYLTSPAPANANRNGTAYAPGTPNSAFSSSRMSQVPTNTSSMFSSGTMSPSSSRTASLMSMQSRTNPRGLSNKLPTIDSSPGTSYQALEDTQPPEAYYQQQPQQRPQRDRGSNGQDFASHKHRSESRASIAESKRSRSSVLSKPEAVLPPPPPRMSSGQTLAEPAGRPSMSLSGTPLRPTRSPRRPEGSVAGAGPDAHLNNTQRQASSPAQFHAFPVGSQGRQSHPDFGSGQADYLAGGYNGSDYSARPPTADGSDSIPHREKNRKSKLLKLPFALGSKAKNRGSLAAADYSEDSIKHQGQQQGGPLRSRGSANTLGASMGDRDYGGEAPVKASRPRKSMHFFERPRAFSSGAGMSANELPPRSHSALGNFPLQGFVGGGGRAQQMNGVEE